MQESFDLKNILRNEKFLETAAILLFISIFLFLKLAQPWDYRLSHTAPAFYNANDNFGNGYVFPQYVKETGNFKYEPSFTVSGYKDVVGYYPVLFTHLSAMLSLASGIETYDTSYIIAILFSISAALLIYFAIRTHSKELAMLSLPFMLGVFNFDFEIARVFGLWIFLTGALFLAAVVWISNLLDKKYSAVILALFLSGAALGHTSEAIFAVGFLALYIFLKRLKDGAFDMPCIKNMALGFGIFLILSAYYLIIFKYTWMVGMPYKFEIMDAPPFAPNLGVKLFDFGITAFLILAGLLIGLKKLAFRKTEEFPFTAVTAGLYILLIGYTNYVGFGIRAWQTRISWPIYFAVFSGTVVYYACRKFIKKWNFKYAVAISLALLILFSFTHINKLQGGGIVDQAGWDTLMWIKNNTPIDSKVMYFYGVLPSQPFSLWAAERTPYIVSTEDYVDGANKGIVKSNYSVNLFIDGSTKMPHKKSLINYEYYADKGVPQTVSAEYMDYYVLAIGLNGAGNPNVVNYNLAIKNAILKNLNIKEMYNNGEYSILVKNRA